MGGNKMLLSRTDLSLTMTIKKCSFMASSEKISHAVLCCMSNCWRERSSDCRPSSFMGFPISPGDHIYSWRAKGVYAHHGIYVGNNMVIHFLAKNESVKSSSISIGSVSTSSSRIGPVPSFSRISPTRPCTNCGYDGSGGVVVTCMDCFLKGGKFKRYEYGVSLLKFMWRRGGTCTSEKPDYSIAVINRAWNLIGTGFGEYSLTHNNCENFALYCKTGKPGIPSGQVAKKCCLCFFLSSCKRLSSRERKQKGALAVKIYGMQ